jgi:indole-3-glycerol phosphate synthase
MTDTPDILKKILHRKAKEVAERNARVSLRTLSQQIAENSPPRGFIEAIDARLQIQQPAIIAEIKKASPSRGVLRTNFYPAEIAESYERAGAACLSVLTDKDFFQGDERHLIHAHESCSLPILRKDFTIDPYQVYEARAIGADCILLIVSALGDAQLQDLTGLAHHLGLDVLIEVHDQEELERALMLGTRLIGINNRNLRTFETDIKITLDLVKKIPKRHIIVSESGINTPKDIAQLREVGVHSFLIGEAFMTAPDPGQALLELVY